MGRVSLHDYDADGNFRWPSAIAMLKAWRFNSKPLLKDVLADQLPYNGIHSAGATYRLISEYVKLCA